MLSEVIRFLIGIGAVGGLLYWARRRVGAPRGLTRSPGLRVVARVGVAKGATVVRVATGDKDLLLGCTAQGVTTLAELPPSAEPLPSLDPPVVASMVSPRLSGFRSPTNRSESFAATLRAAVKGRSQPS
jgi:flagellar biogenesis protein FliO